MAFTQFQSAHARLQFRALLVSAPAIFVWVLAIGILTGEDFAAVALAAAAVYVVGVVVFVSGRRRRDRFGLFVSADQIAVVGPFTDDRHLRTTLDDQLDVKSVPRASMDKLEIVIGGNRGVVGWLVHATRRSPWTPLLYRTPNLLYRRTVESIEEPVGAWQAVPGVEWTDGDPDLVLKTIRDALETDTR